MSNSEPGGPEHGSPPPAYSYSELADKGLPLPDEDSYREAISDADARQTMREQEIEYARVMAQRAFDRAESAERRHQPVELVDERFDRAMQGTEVIQDPETGFGYGVFMLNPDKAGRPLVLCLGLTTVAQTGAGRDVVHEFFDHVDRPLVVIENEGAGTSDAPDRYWPKGITLEALGESRLRVLDTLARKHGDEDFGEFDIAGYSFGGGVALATAEAAGSRARHVITLQTEGFEDSGREQLRNRARGLVRDARAHKAVMEPEIIARNKAARGLGEKPPRTGFLGKLRSLRGQARVMLVGDESAQAVRSLDPSTQWTTIVGSQDALTDWQRHLTSTRERNNADSGGSLGSDEPARGPHSKHNSSVHILAGDTHFTVKERRAEMAEEVAMILRRDRG